MSDPKVICEQVTTQQGTPNELVSLVQYEDTPEGNNERDSCLARLSALGIAVVREQHPVVTAETNEDGTEDDPAMSWEDLCDLVAQ